MKIVVNTRLLLKNKLEGIGWFTYETLKRITKSHPEHHFIFIFDRTFDQEFIFSDNITPVVLSPQARHPLLFYIWFEYSITRILKDLKADLFLSPDGYLSLSTEVKSLAVIHDLNFEHYPKDLPYLVRRYYQYFFPKFAHKAVRIATVSEYSKQDIATTYGVESNKIDVVYNGVGESFAPVSEEEKRNTKNKYTRSSDFFLFIGSLHPRKNITRLFLAFDEFKKSTSSDIKLLIVGQKYWWTNEIEHAFKNMQFQADVLFTGGLPHQELKNIIASAMALVYVSYFEGFGIPILEAMQCDVPVITSNITSMPEVAGDAALFVDPFSVDSIKEAMLKIANDEQMRITLIEKGRERRQVFSWDKTAGLLWESIEKIIQ